MATVREVKFTEGKKDRGTFHAKTYNVFDQEQADDYAELRTRANDASSGISIERIEQFVRKTTVVEGDGAERSVTTTEDMYIMVQYWEKELTREEGDSDADITDVVSIERAARR